MPTPLRRRVLGSFYTPDWIADWMVSQAMSRRDSHVIAPGFRVVDPACGDGAFLFAMLNWFSRQQAQTPQNFHWRLELVRRHLFGVDADPVAIDALHLRMSDWIGATDNTEVLRVVHANFRHGDALLGEALSDGDGQFPNERFSPTLQSFIGGVAGVESSSPQRSALTAGSPLPVNWRTAFPDAAAAGGFDLVIGNPPYRRELNAKAEFDRIAASSLGKRWRVARMDLWHYFAHRGLDLLKPGGRMAFIVNSYWTGSTAARPIRERMAAETSVEELVFLGAANLFRDVSGRHMIFQLRKGRDEHLPCRIADLADLSTEQIKIAFEEQNDPTQSQLFLQDRTVIRLQNDLWYDGQLRADVTARKANRELPVLRLGEVFEVRQGIAENPPFVTKSVAQELGEPAMRGRGVFVLTDVEIAELRLNQTELSMLRPYYSLSAIDRFKIAPGPSHQILYLTKASAPTLSGMPAIEAHLKRFQPFLERRREVQDGTIAWWHLHWPRREELFTSSRILCVQMGIVPRFAYATSPTFVGFSVNVIVAKETTSEGRQLPLTTLTGILNSSYATSWFEAHAKKRGVNLDISGTVLKQFPLPNNSSPDLEAAIDQLVRNWQSHDERKESQLDQIVDELYGNS